MFRACTCAMLLLGLTGVISGAAWADEETDRRIADLERRIDGLPGPVQQHGSNGASAFLFGAFCALWAQNTNRNPWLWFFLGLFFSVITVIVLLIKNSGDRKRGRKPDLSFGDV